MLRFLRYNNSMQANNTQNNSKQSACMLRAVCYNASKRNATAHNVATATNGVQDEQIGYNTGIQNTRATVG